MTNQCLNHRYITYDCCRTCRNQSARCPEYLSDIHTRQIKPYTSGEVVKVERRMYSSIVPDVAGKSKLQSAESYNIANCDNEGTL
jgi:hypothetical protein